MFVFRPAQSTLPTGRCPEEEWEKELGGTAPSATQHGDHHLLAKLEQILRTEGGPMTLLENKKQKIAHLEQWKEVLKVTLTLTWDLASQFNVQF